MNTPLIPARFRALGQFCKSEWDTRETGVHQYTKGWVKNRSGGGGHGISLAERENKWAHGYCVDRKSEGTLEQQRMFDLPTTKYEFLSKLLGDSGSHKITSEQFWAQMNKHGYTQFDIDHWCEENRKRG